MVSCKPNPPISEQGWVVKFYCIDPNLKQTSQPFKEIRTRISLYILRAQVLGTLYSETFVDHVYVIYHIQLIHEPYFVVLLATKNGNFVRMCFNTLVLLIPIPRVCQRTGRVDIDLPVLTMVNRNNIKNIPLWSDTRSTERTNYLFYHNLMFSVDYIWLTQSTLLGVSNSFFVTFEYLHNSHLTLVLLIMGKLVFSSERVFI